jgi:hypothetical protein
VNKIEALEWAADYAERNKLFEPALNNRGYPVDGQKPATPEERANIIIKLADQVTESEPVPYICSKCDEKLMGRALGL